MPFYSAGPASPSSSSPAPAAPTRPAGGFYTAPVASAPKAAEPPAPKKDETWGDYGMGLFESAIGGAMFNFNDEVRAAGTATRKLLSGGGNKPWGQLYDEELNATRNRMAGFSKAHPVASTAASIAGSMAVPVPGAAPATFAGALGKGALVGGVGGALAGAGAGETGAERFGGALSGATLGGALGAGASAAIKGGTTALGRISPQVARREGAALLGRAVQEEAQSPAELAASIQRANRAGTAGVTLGDVAQSGPVRALAEDALQHPNRNSGRYGAYLAERQQGALDRVGRYQGGQMNRLTDAVQQATGVARERAFETADALARQRSAAARQHFDAAQRFNPADNPTVRQVWADVVASDYGKEGVAAAKRLWSATQPRRPFPLSVENAADTVPDMRTMQTFKEGLDDVVTRLYREGRGQEANAARALRDRFRDTLTAANPAYGEALKRYAGDSAMIEALERGQKFLATSADEVEDLLARRLSPGEAEQYRIGAVTALVDKLRSKRPGPTADFTGELMKPDTLRRVMALLPDDQSREELVTRLTTEQGMSGLASRMGNSATSRRQEAARMVEGGEPGAAGLRGYQRMGGLTMGDLVFWLHDKVTGKLADAMTRERRAAIAELLMRQDDQALQLLQGRLGGGGAPPPAMPGAALAGRASQGGGYAGGTAASALMGDRR